MLSKERAAEDGHWMPSWREVFLYFLFLGFVNVGGPVAQITMMYNHMVERRKWLTEDRFVKIMAFCHIDSRLFQIAWLFLKTGLFSFGGAYASLVFVQRGAVAQYHWLSDGQLLDGVAMSVATPGPFMLFTTFAGYLAGGIAGAVLATFFVFLPSFVFVTGGTHYIEKVRDNRSIEAFLAGISAAVVGVIALFLSISFPKQLLAGQLSPSRSLLSF
jgi:chromate transport protein ChrA